MLLETIGVHSVGMRQRICTQASPPDTETYRNMSLDGDCLNT